MHVSARAHHPTPTSGHARCSSAHRLVTVAAVASALLLVAGCGGGTSSNAAQLPTPDKTTTAAKAAHHGPVGQCHLLSAKTISGAVDHSQAMPCSKAFIFNDAAVTEIYTKLTKASRQNPSRPSLVTTLAGRDAHSESGRR